MKNQDLTVEDVKIDFFDKICDKFLTLKVSVGLYTRPTYL